MDNKQIGQYLLRKRKEESKTQKEIADNLGVTYQAVSRWENGDSIPDIETLCMIADMYHVSVDEILQRKHTEQDPDNEMAGVLPFMSLITYVVAIVVFLAINAVWYTEVAMGLFAIICIGGLIPANLYYFYEFKRKTIYTTLYYIGSYIPLVIGIILVINA